MKQNGREIHDEIEMQLNNVPKLSLCTLAGERTWASFEFVLQFDTIEKLSLIHISEPTRPY